MRRTKAIVVLLAVSIFLLISLWSVSDIGKLNKQDSIDPSALICTHKGSLIATEQNIVSKGTKPKLLLFFNFPSYYMLQGASGFSAFASCEHKCELTTNKSRLAEADTAIFYSHTVWPMPPPHKRPGQNWVFFAVEAPPYSNIQFKDPVWHRLFNWTMGYRTDADIWHGYVRLVKKTIPAPQESRERDVGRWKELFAKKTKMVAWFVSHCETQSLREKYVTELSKHIPVDIYGGCGTLKCEDRVKCLDKLTAEYKFYLAFENSLCVDYATEKLLNILKMSSLIPVVRGGADYHKLFPANSMVVTSDFSSPENLAKHLLALANNEEAYIKHFTWSWDYNVEGNAGLPLCDICRLMHKPHTLSCVYNDVHSWWVTDTCFSPKDV